MQRYNDVERVDKFLTFFDNSWSTREGFYRASFVFLVYTNKVTTAQISLCNTSGIEAKQSGFRIVTYIFRWFQVMYGGQGPRGSGNSTSSNVS